AVGRRWQIVLWFGKVSEAECKILPVTWKRAASPFVCRFSVAGALLFRGDHIEKPISVLSGGERARLCLAGLLLGNDKFLILDEPGNHLDLDTVEALAEALISHAGTVIFTSHDRHFMQRVASCVIEVRDGRVVT
ncbi:MAG: AAA family ATPase, partial [Planctomycetaceae bacterium]